jgi:hypothetical protein
MASSTPLSWSSITPLPSPPAPAPAHGATGVVISAAYRGRKVAVKVLKTAPLAAGEVERVTALLQAEMEKLARAYEGGLNEFVVVPVGVVAGVASPPWLAALGAHAWGGGAQQLCGLAMKWEEGGTLAELLHSPTRAWGAGTGDRLQLCAQLASGLASLHAAGVIHGDVKGENVLLSDHPAAPHPRFADFGFAEIRAATSAASSRVSAAVGEKRGTWPYMAPEMLREPPEGVSRGGDVFALGVLCWEVLTGGKPWDGYTEQRRIVAGLSGSPATLGTPLTAPPLPVDTPAAVKELLGSCLSAEKAARPRAARAAEALHQAAQDMASGAFDIFLSHAWVDGAHAPLTTEVYLRLLDAGYRVWLDTAEMGFDMDLSMQCGIAKSGCVVALLSARYGTKPDPAKDNCLKELRWAKGKGKPIVACLADPTPGWFPAAGGEVAALVGTHHLFPDLRAAAAIDWRADVGAAEREVLTKAPSALPKVLQLVREVLRRAEPPVAPRVEPAAEAEGSDGGGGGGVGALAAGVAAMRVVGGGAPAPVARHAGRPLRGHCVAKLRQQHNEIVWTLAIADGALLSGSESLVCAWARSADGALSSIAVKAYGGIAALPGGRIATTDHISKVVEVYDSGTGQRLHQLRGHTDGVRCSVALPGSVLASGSNDKTVRIWNANTGAHVATLEGHSEQVYELAALPDGCLASCSTDKTIRLWNVATRACTQVLQHPQSVYALAVLDGGRLASGCRDNNVYIWSTAGGVQEAVLKGHPQYVTSLAVLPNGLLASGGFDATVRVWDVGARVCVAVLEGDRTPVQALAALPDGRLAVSYSHARSVSVWTLTTCGSPEDAAAAEAARCCVEVEPAPAGAAQKRCILQ